MSNFLGDVLSTVRFKSAVYFKHGFCSPWGMDVPKGSFSQFHLVVGGRCILRMDDEVIDLEKGDISIFPHGHPHKIMDQSDSSCRLGANVVEEIQNGGNPYSGDSVNCHLICGHYEMDDEVRHPLFEQLPRMIIIKASDYGRFDLIHSIFELVTEEMNGRKAGHKLVSLKLAEVLFISIIRHYYINRPAGQFNVFNDEAIYQALDIIHKELDSSLSVDILARKTSMSRTLFIERFKKAMGETPMKYVANWRLAKAGQLIRHTDKPLTEIGELVGYPSITSFNRAFKQKFAISPGKFRKQSTSAGN